MVSAIAELLVKCPVGEGSRVQLFAYVIYSAYVCIHFHFPV